MVGILKKLKFSTKLDHLVGQILLICGKFRGTITYPMSTVILKLEKNSIQLAQSTIDKAAAKPGQQVNNPNLHRVGGNQKH